MAILSQITYLQVSTQIFVIIDSQCYLVFPNFDPYINVSWQLAQVPIWFYCQMDCWLRTPQVPYENFCRQLVVSLKFLNFLVVKKKEPQERGNNGEASRLDGGGDGKSGENLGMILLFICSA